MIKMKALRSFGIFGANEGHVRRGREFAAATDGRAKELEELGLAYRVEIKPEPKSLNKIAPPSNKAAEAGPLDSPGGTTGAAEPAPSSPPDRQPRTRRSVRSKDGDLLS